MLPWSYFVPFATKNTLLKYFYFLTDFDGRHFGISSKNRVFWTWCTYILPDCIKIQDLDSSHSQLSTHKHAHR